MKTAVVAYNLGGPDSPDAVKPFLFNLFSDPLILRQPAPIRWLLAKIISARRAPVAREIYAHMGGGSPILGETRAQADALEKALGDDQDWRVFVAMRYWHPFAEECARDVAAWGAEKVILLPLYPQFSTTTTESFMRVWQGAATAAALTAPTALVCCYPAEEGFVETIASLTRDGIDEARKSGTPRVLFSAHGIPEKFVTAGDPYQVQIERTVAAVVERLAMPELDYAICYQSRVGPVEWLKPYTDEAITQAANEGRTIVVVPVAFVSEHSETLVELDIEYAKLAEDNGAAGYVRVPTVGTGAAFIAGLARVVREAASADGVRPYGSVRICPASCTACPVPAAGGG